RFMKQHFGEEAETYNWFLHTIKKNLNNYFIIIDSTRKIIGLSNSQYIKLPRETRHETIQSVIAVWHIAVDSSHRNRGLATWLYENVFRKYLLVGRRRRHEILAIVGEAVESAENFLNSLGRKRLFYKQGDGLHEVSYMCPPLDYDPNTGCMNG